MPTKIHKAVSIKEYIYNIQKKKFVYLVKSVQIKNMLILKRNCGNNRVVHFVELMYTKSEDRG